MVHLSEARRAAMVSAFIVALGGSLARAPSAVAVERCVLIEDFTATWCVTCQANKKTSIEIPAVAAKLAQRGRYSAIICLGVIFQGETSHAQHIGWGITHALAQIQVQHKLPVIHGVFLFEKVTHARVRCLGAKHNRGMEAAQTALEMARVMSALR